MVTLSALDQSPIREGSTGALATNAIGSPSTIAVPLLLALPQKS